jgi:5-methylcytosine-specific restriction endonuclease McrA
MEACFEGLEAVCPGFAPVVDFAGAGGASTTRRKRCAGKWAPKWRCSAVGTTPSPASSRSLRSTASSAPRACPTSTRLISNPGLTNSKLFARDRNVCAYCGGHFHEEDLTREHIIPFAQNGRDHWMNVVTACRACNHRKSHRTPEQARMPCCTRPMCPACGKTSSCATAASWPTRWSS